MRPGISPHAPYSIETIGYQKCLDVARAKHLPLATHLAETPEEIEFLAHHTGPFRELWSLLGAWDDNVPRTSGGPIRMARDLGLLDYPTLLAHVNYADDDELEMLSRGKASVVYCPRTHEFFGHPPHRWRDMLARGINVAVGTDSCASSPDLNLVDDLRLLHRLAPDIAAHSLWEMATTRAARAIDCPEVGSLSPGKFADAVVFSTNTNDPLHEILEENRRPTEVWINGELHPQAGL
jgi:cytosine/adenosine deaminase-related metal-dependent hydrolase